MERLCRTIRNGKRLVKSNSSTSPWTPTGGWRITPPRSAATRARADFHSSGRFLWNGTWTPSEKAVAISMAVKHVPGDCRTTDWRERRESRAASTSPSTAASSYRNELDRSMWKRPGRRNDASRWWTTPYDMYVRAGRTGDVGAGRRPRWSASSEIMWARARRPIHGRSKASPPSVSNRSGSCRSSSRWSSRRTSSSSPSIWASPIMIDPMIPSSGAIRPRS